MKKFGVNWDSTRNKRDDVMSDEEMTEHEKVRHRMFGPPLPKEHQDLYEVYDPARQSTMKDQRPGS